MNKKTNSAQSNAAQGFLRVTASVSELLLKARDLSATVFLGDGQEKLPIVYANIRV